MSAMALKTEPVTHEVDPKQVIWDALGDDIKKIRPTAGDVLVCVYERPKTKKIKNALGQEVEFDLSSTSRVTEDKFQGAVGMIVAVGPLFAERYADALGDPVPGIGDWVAIRRGDAITMVIQDRMLCQLQGDFIRAVLTDPDVII